MKTLHLVLKSKWYDKIVRKCKTCGNACIIITQGEQK